MSGTPDFDPRAQWPHIRISCFTPTPALDRDEYLAEVQQRGTVEKVTAVEQIAALDIEIRGQIHLDRPLLRYLTEPGAAEIIELCLDKRVSDEDRRDAVCAAYWACVQADHNPPRRWGDGT